MPIVRNAVGREYVVPPDHWAVTSPEFVLLPDPPPEVAPPVVESPRARQKTRK